WRSRSTRVLSGRGSHGLGEPAGKVQDRVAGRESGMPSAPPLGHAHAAARRCRHPVLRPLHNAGGPLPSVSPWPSGPRGTTVPAFHGGGENAVYATRHRHNACAAPRSAGTSRRLPWLLRALNRFGHVLTSCGLPPIRLSDAALM